ncbi:CVNH domain-containing protein [Aspergillus stella-maris]|uniref:CVNH domain-containing protein n=1 Tax=Aspergillus stella-maris TaxID=1810926 RepID=UPI003CCD33CE
MSFHETAQNIRIEDGHRLVADLQTESGDWVFAEMDLNTVLGNNDGHFEWEGNNFSESAESDDTSFDIEGAGVPILRAALRNCDGEAVAADVNLSERIGNDNGNFSFV